MKETKRISVAIASAAALLFISTAAYAVPSVDMVWRSTQSNVISTPTISVSNTVIADIVLRNDGAPNVNGVFISIAFDNTELFGIGGRELVSVNLPGMGNSMAPVGPGTNMDNANGVVTNFDVATTTAGLATGSRTLGSVRFHVISASGTGEADVQANIDNTGTDSIGTTAGLSTNTTFGAASLNGPPVVPEPTTAILVVAGLAGLGYAGRRNLR
jgi:hypothetical protein